MRQSETTMTRQLVNGFSNAFLGWGGEDDDKYNRVHDAGLRIARLKKDGFYKMAKHADEVKNPEVKRLLQTGRRRQCSHHVPQICLVLAVHFSICLQNDSFCF